MRKNLHQHLKCLQLTTVYVVPMVSRGARVWWNCADKKEPMFALRIACIHGILGLLCAQQVHEVFHVDVALKAVTSHLQTE